MKLRKKKKNLSGIPTSSMSDVAFLLLIFFLTTTKFDIKKGLPLVLPEPSNQENTKKVKLDNKNLTRININDKGQIQLKYTLNNEEVKEVVDINKLETKIRSLIKNNKDMVFQLKTDRNSKYDHMVTALDVLQMAGAEKIALATN